MKTIKQLKHWRKIYKEQGYSIQSMELAFNQAMDYIETMEAMFTEFRKRATLDPEHPVMIENAKLKEEVESLERKVKLLEKMMVE